MCEIEMFKLENAHQTCPQAEGRGKSSPYAEECIFSARRLLHPCSLSRKPTALGSELRPLPCHDDDLHNPAAASCFRDTQFFLASAPGSAPTTLSDRRNHLRFETQIPDDMKNDRPPTPSKQRVL